MKIKYICPICKNLFIDYESNHRKQCSRRCNGKIPHKCQNGIYTKCKQCNKVFYRWISNKTKKFCSKTCYGNWQKGKMAYPNIVGKRGIKPRTYHLKKRDRHGGTYDKEWRMLIFKRDNFTCQKCGCYGGKLQAHHKKAYKAYPQLRYDLNNGETLCIDCHKKTKTYGWQNYWISQIAQARIDKERNQLKLAL